ncbi:MAG TPA: hypothetical protein VN783_15545 [Thermoanaerobaculia bacterium]|nr:hypothetical protein [Thermoanaerobaculia bacterium]
MSITRDDLSRWSGLANALAGAATAVYWFIHPGLDDPQKALLGRWEAMNVAFIVLLLLFLWGLTGLYLAQVEKAGALGFAGYLLAFAGSAMFIAAGAHDAFVTPLLTVRDAALLGAQGPLLTGGLGKFFMTTGLTFALGYLLFGIATFRAKVLPPWAALIAGLSASILGTSPLQPALVRTAGCVVFGLANVWLGWALWGRKAGALQQGR